MLVLWGFVSFFRCCATMTESLVYSVSGLFIFFPSQLKALALGNFCCFRRETVAKNWSVTQMLHLELAGEITRSVW